MYLAASSQGWGEATLKPGPKSARGTMGAPFSDRPPVTDPRYVFSPAVTWLVEIRYTPANASWLNQAEMLIRAFGCCYL